MEEASSEGEQLDAYSITATNGADDDRDGDPSRLARR
jgi:hypothetical protein